MFDDFGPAHAQGPLLCELAALLRGIGLGDPYLADVSFDLADGAYVTLGAPAGPAVYLPLTATRFDCHRALAVGRELPPPDPEPIIGFPPDETDPPREQFAELVHDLGNHAAGVAYLGLLAKYQQITYDGCTRAAVTIIGPDGGRYRSLFDFAGNSGPSVGIPYNIADWIKSGRGSQASDGALEWRFYTEEPAGQ
jgi:hypothetical protein